MKDKKKSSKQKKTANTPKTPKSADDIPSNDDLLESEPKTPAVMLSDSDVDSDYEEKSPVKKNAQSKFPKDLIKFNQHEDEATKGIAFHLLYVEVTAGNSGTGADYLINALHSTLTFGEDLEEYIRPYLYTKSTPWEQLKANIIQNFTDTNAKIHARKSLRSYQWDDKISVQRHKSNISILVTKSGEIKDSTYVMDEIRRLIPSKFKPFIASRINVYDTNYEEIWTTIKLAQENSHFLEDSSSGLETISEPEIACAATSNNVNKNNLNKYKPEIKERPCYNFFCDKRGCKYGEQCKFSHSPELFFNNKGKNLYFSLFTTSNAGSTDKMLFIDSCSNVNIAKNKALLSDLKYTKLSAKINGIGQDKSLISNHIGQLDPFGSFYYAESCPLNIVALSNLQSNFHIIYENDIFTLKHKTTNQVFKSIKYNGLYALDLTNISSINSPLPSTAIALVNMAEINLATLHNSLGHPSTQAMLNTLQSETFKHLNINVTFNQLDVITKECTGCIMSKSVRHPIKHNTKQPSKLLQTLHGDIFQLMANTGYYLILVDELSGFILTSYMPHKSSKCIYESIKAMQDKMTPFNHKIQNIYFDKDTGFQGAQGQINKLGVAIHQVAPEDHVNIAERAIRTVKTKLQAVLHTLPFEFPIPWLPYLVKYVTQANNLVINVHNKSVTPYQQVFGKVPDYTNLCLNFGEMVYFKDANVKPLRPQSIPCIVLGRETIQDVKGVYTVFNLTTQSICTRRKIISIPPDQRKAINEYRSKLSKFQCLPTGITNLFDQTENIHTNVLDTTAIPVPDTNFSNKSKIAKKTADKHERNKLYTVERILCFKFKKQKKVFLVKFLNYPDSANEWVPRHMLRNYSQKDLRGVPHYSKWKQMEKLENTNTSSFLAYCLTANRIIESKIEHDENLTTEAIKDELGKLIELNVFKPLDPNTVNKDIIKHTVNSFINLRDKTNTQGQFVKRKARIIANGSSQHKQTYDPNDTYSPTIKSSSVKLILAHAAYSDYELATADIASAFLNSDIQDTVYVRFNSKLATTVVNLYPDFKKYLTPENNIYVKLNKGLYGLIQSPKLWFTEISTSLINFGFHQSLHDRCVYVKNEGPKKTIVGLHVDDLLISASEKSLIHELKAYLIEKYKNITYYEGDELEYIGMKIIRDRQNRTIKLNQFGFIKQLLEKCKIVDTATSPASSKLFKDDKPSSTPKQGQTQKEFLSKVMSLNYLTLTRADIQASVSYLCTKTQKPSSYDHDKLNRVLKYINKTKEMCLTLSPADMGLHVYIDASFNTHGDAKGHSGLIISLGELSEQNGAAILTKSRKQKLVTKSSCESELVAISDGIDDVLSIEGVMKDLNIHNNKPSTLYQDNKSTITLIEKGSGSTKRSKHINIRFFFVADKVKDKSITLKHLSTDKMPADLLTKPMEGQKFLKFSSMIQQNTILLSQAA
jgi:hypothetical protein